MRVRLGWDPYERIAYAVAARSIQDTSPAAQVQRLDLGPLRDAGLYRRQTLRRGKQAWDVPSDAPMSTEHAIARFFIPHLEGHAGTVLFADGDILVRADLGRLFEQADQRFAVQCVQHPPQDGASLKKDGHLQTFYARKNWSSVMLLHCGHPAWHRLTLDMLNTRPGRDLHAFCWLNDHEIGALDPTWNHLVGVSPNRSDASLVHYTLGTPNVVGGDPPYADEWWAMARKLGVSRPDVSRETGAA
jgi:lipopolysaccharide biosynthesis glycosyltransferase